MRIVFSLIILLFTINAQSKDSAQEKLYELNQYWSQHQNAINSTSVLPVDESSWIAYHLMLVETALRNTTTKGLSAGQASQRMKCLNHLHQYWQAGRFPINDDYSYRTPIFIDRHNNFCAVGYLIATSGHEALARRISAESNLAYVRDMHYPELKVWASENGFMIDELAWIQPGYGYARNLNPVGKGLDGSVYELYPDTAAGKLYVGGAFKHADDTLSTGSVVFVTQDASGFVWHAMGGISSPVYAIAKHKGSVFAGSNAVYRWNDTLWQRVGCLKGKVNDLATTNGRLYAAGTFFDTCSSSTSNFASWNDTSWRAIAGLSGTVNTMEVMDTTLVLGGNFSYNGAPVNAVKWSQGAGFIPFANRIANEVNDFERLDSTLYAVCKKTDATWDSLNLAVRLINNQWTPLINSHLFGYYNSVNGRAVSIDAVCYEGRQLLIGGSFRYSSSNCSVIPPSFSPTPTYFSVDSAVNKIAVFKDNVFIGGDFVTSYPYVTTPTPIMHIGWAPDYGRSIVGIASAHVSHNLACYPNPAYVRSAITIKSDIPAENYSIYDLTGRLLDEGKLESATRITLPDIGQGVYLLTVKGRQGDCAYSRLQVQ